MGDSAGSGGDESTSSPTVVLPAWEVTEEVINALGSIEALQHWNQGVLCGTVGGMAGTVAGQPLDVIKTRVQASSSQSTGIFSGLRLLWRKEGVGGLFRGLLPPLLGQGAMNALAFGAESFTRPYAQMYFQTDSYLPMFFSGCAAGAMQSMAAAPAELLKIQLQVKQQGSRPARRGSAVLVAKDIYRTWGVRGFYHGWGITLARDTHSFGFYFLTFDVIKRHLTKLFKKTHKKLEQHKVPGFLSKKKPEVLYQDIVALIAGGFAGMISWIGCYPVDVVKSRMQAVPIGASPSEHYRGIVDGFRRTIRDHGVRFLFRGLDACLLRAFVVNAATFMVYERACAFFYPEDDDP